MYNLLIVCTWKGHFGKRHTKSVQTVGNPIGIFQALSTNPYCVSFSILPLSKVTPSV